MIKKVEVKKGEVWESTLGSRREVLEVADRGGAIVKESNGHTYYWCPENVNSETFHKLISRSATIHGHMHATPSCFKPPSLERAGEFDDPEVHFHTEFGPPYNFCCISKPVLVCEKCGKQFILKPFDSMFHPVCPDCILSLCGGHKCDIDFTFSFDPPPVVGEVYYDGVRKTTFEIDDKYTRVSDDSEYHIVWSDGLTRWWPAKLIHERGKLVEGIPAIGDGHPDNHRFFYAVCQKCGAGLGYVPHGHHNLCGDCVKKTLDLFRAKRKPKPSKLEMVKPGQIWLGKHGTEREILWVMPGMGPVTKIRTKRTSTGEEYEWKGRQIECVVLGTFVGSKSRAKIDTVLINQVWEGVNYYGTRQIVDICRADGKVKTITTRLIQPAGDNEESHWSREQAEKYVLGRLVENIWPPPLDVKTCSFCGKQFPFSCVVVDGKDICPDCAGKRVGYCKMCKNFFINRDSEIPPPKDICPKYQAKAKYPVMGLCAVCESVFQISNTLDPEPLWETVCPGCRGKKVEEPKEVLSEVFLSIEGDMRMRLPYLDQTMSRAAHQGDGFCGRTCEGFVFKEAPGYVYASPIGWVIPALTEVKDSRFVREYKGGTHTQRINATHAVWGKAKG